jgi:hypothetical protein
MKGTLFSADFVKDSNGNLRLLEFNTDTGFITQELENFNFTEFKQLLVNNNISELDIIYKSSFQQKFVNQLTAAMAPDISLINLHKENIDTIYPTQIQDSDGKFILRLAYDESALFDSEYCKNRLNVFNLFTDNSINDYCVGYFHSSALGEKNTLTKEINPINIPDATIKDISEVHNPIDFFKIGSQTENESAEDRWNNFITENTSEDKLIEQYHFHSSSVDENNHITSYRFFGLVYGSNLDVLTLHTYKISSIFDLPTDLTPEIDENQYTNKIADHHYYELTTNLFKHDSAGILSTHEILTDENTYKPLSEFIVGDYVKSYYISRPVEEEDANFSFPTSEFPSGSYLTSSIVIYKKLENLKYNSMFELKVDSDSFFCGLSKSFLVFDSSSDTGSFKPIYNIDPEVDYLYDTSGNLIDIDELNFYVTTDNNLTYIELDVEDTDTYIIKGSTAINSVVSHNAPCFVAGTQILLENGLTKNIEDVVVGDYVMSFDLKNNEPKVSKVLNTFSKTIDKVVKYEFSDGSTLKATADHPIYVTSKGWANYLGEPEQYNNVSSEETKPTKKLEVAKIEIGDVVKLYNGEVKLVNMNVIEKSTLVYNLSEIEKYHTYFANNILVHNLRPVFSCFTAETKVTMEDGGFKNISDIEVGDYVLSYKDGKYVRGVVTDKLIHPTNDVVEVVKYKGMTSDRMHPFYDNGKWKPICEALGVEFGSQYVDNFYNLEIDGNLLFESEHNFIVEDFIVSGLGDHKLLNTTFKRQAIFQ